MPAFPVLPQRPGRQHGRRHTRFHVNRTETVETVVVPAWRPRVGRPPLHRKHGVDVAVEQEGRPSTVFDAGDHIRPVALGRLKFWFETVRLQPPRDMTLHRAFLAGITADGDQLGGERGGFLRVEQVTQP